MLQTGQQYSMEAKDLPALSIRCIVLSLKYVGRRALLETLVQDQCADWGLVERATGGHSALGDAEARLSGLLDLLDWPGLTGKERLDIEANHGRSRPP